MFCLKEAALNRLVENTTWRPHSPEYLLAVIISSLSSRLLFFSDHGLTEAPSGRAGKS